MKRFIALITALLLMTGCSSTEYIQNDEYSSNTQSTSSEIPNSSNSSTTSSETSSSSESSLIESSSSEVTSEDNSNIIPEEEIKPTKKEPEYVKFFEEQIVHTLNISIDEEDWQSICNNPTAKEYKHVDLVIDDNEYLDCALKTHGNSTLKTTTDREKLCFPFKIKFDKYNDDNSLFGLDEIVLCNNIIDTSYARQYAGYEVFRALGLPAPLTTFFEVYLNSEYFGLYTCVEDVDSDFLKRNYDNKKGNLYKMDEMATLLPNMSSWSVDQKKGEDTSREDLNLLIKTLDEMPLGEKGNIEDILDVNSVLAYLGIGSVIHHCDGYAGYPAHNYCLYNNNGLFYMIPWDMDLCFYQTGWGFRQSPGAQMDIKDGLTDTAKLEDRPLVQKLLDVPEYYEIYLDYCQKAYEWLKDFNENGVDELFGRIESSIKLDPKHNYNSFKNEYNKNIRTSFAGYIDERVEYLEKRIPEIYAELKEELDMAEDIRY